MKLEMLLSSLLLTILSIKFKPGEALNGVSIKRTGRKVHMNY